MGWAHEDSRAGVVLKRPVRILRRVESVRKASNTHVLVCGHEIVPVKRQMVGSMQECGRCLDEYLGALDLLPFLRVRDSSKSLGLFLCSEEPFLTVSGRKLTRERVIAGVSKLLLSGDGVLIVAPHPSILTE